MKPGTYTMKYYQGEFAVAETSVTVSAGSATTKNISGSVQTGTTIFKIGEWDGQLVPSLLPFVSFHSQLTFAPIDQPASATPKTNCACTRPTRACPTGVP